MSDKCMGMDRRTFLKNSLIAAAGLTMATSVENMVWGKLPSDGDLADSSLYRLSKMIRDGELTSTKLVELYLDRIQKFDGRDGINAYITVVAERALKEAKELDKLAEKKMFKGLLHGLPIA